MKRLQTVPEEQVHPRRNTFQLILLILLSSFLLLITFIKTNSSLPLDLAITKFLQSFHNSLFYYILYGLTYIGFFWGQLLLPIAIAGVFYWCKQRREGLFILLSTYGAIAISEIIKRVVARPRPDGSLVIQVGQYIRHDSFPSGHVLFYMGLFGYLLYLSFVKLKPGWERTILIIVLGLLIFLIGVSRVYLGAHWFSDVLGSYIIGTSWLLVIIRLHHSLKGLPK